MTIRVTCPSCNKSYQLDDSLRGKKVRCRECKELLTVPGAAADAIRRGPPPLPGARRDDEDRPGRRSRRRDEEDDDDDRPRRSTKAKQSSALPLILGSVAAGVALTLGIVGSVFFFLHSDAPVAVVAVPNPPPAGGDAARPPAAPRVQLPLAGAPAAPVPAGQPAQGAAPAVALAAADVGWKVKVGAAPDGELKLSAAPLHLPDKTDFFDGAKALAFSPASRRVAIGYHGPPGRKSDSRIVLCDLARGAVVSHVTVAGTMTPVALHADGTQLVLRRNDFGFGNQDRLEVLELSAQGDAKKQEFKKRSFEPYGDLKSRDRDIVWCDFIDDERLATVNTGGKLVVWDFPGLKASYSFMVQGGSLPALSPDRKLLAYTTGKEVGLLDVDAGKVVAQQPSPNNMPFALFAFSPGGQWLACSAFDRLFIWNAATGELHREISTSGVHSGGQLAWTSDKHVLVGGKALYDVERQLRLWDYQGHELAQPFAGRTWFVVHGGPRREQGTLVSAMLPHSGAEAALQKASADPDFMVLRPGTVVKLNVSGLPDPAERDKAVASLAKRLEKNGCAVGDHGSIELIASADVGKERAISYYTMPGPGFGPRFPPPVMFGKAGLPPGAEVKTAHITEHYARLKFVYQGQTLWQTSSLNIPHTVRLEEGETMQEHLRKRERPNYALYQTVELPRRLLRTKGSDALGSSQVTMTGVR